MEKFVYTLILMIGLNITVAFADDKVVEPLGAVEEYTYIPVESDELPARVQEVLALAFPCFVVNSVEVKSLSDHTVVYKVVLSDPENMTAEVYITDKGEILA